MGNSSGKDNFEFLKSRFKEEEQLKIRNVYLNLTNCEEDKLNVKILNEKDFIVYTEKSLPDNLRTQIYHGMLRLSTPKGVSFYGFATYLCYTLKGTFEEQANLFSLILCKGNPSISITDLKSVLNEVAIILPTVLNSCAKYRSWKFSNDEETVSRLSKLFFRDLLRKEKDLNHKWNSTSDVYNQNDIEEWFSKETLLAQALCTIINHSLPVTSTSYVNLPLSYGVNWSNFKTALDLPSLWLLNNSLLSNLRDEWQLLYASGIHGESFSTMLGHILKKGPTLIIVKDKDGYVFGGFASVNWDYKPKFMGTEDCFVFQLYPETKVYGSSGFNNNFMYLCLHQHTLPNGLGFGGQLNNFGLWIDAEFDHGHSILSCATYKSEKLSCKEQFQVDTVEVWRVGPASSKENDDEKNKKSILDCDDQAKALLTMVHRMGDSEHLRELGPENDDTS